jgi:hypothetical protein
MRIVEGTWESALVMEFGGWTNLACYAAAGLVVVVVVVGLVWRECFRSRQSKH